MERRQLYDSVPGDWFYLAADDARFSQFKTLAGDLTRDFFAQHYPGSDLSDVGKNYQPLRQQAGELVALIKELLPQHFVS